MSDDKNDEGAQPEPAKRASSVIAQLQDAPAERAVYGDQMAQLLERLFDYTMDSFDESQKARDGLLRHLMAKLAADMAQAHARLVTARDKHLKSRVR